jgi:hypothetical protein
MKYIIPFITILILSVSCKKSWLHVVPLGDQVAVTTDDYDKLMNDGMFYIYPSTGGWQEPQLMGDEVAAETPYFNITGNAGYLVRPRLFQWQDSLYPTTTYTPNALKTSYLQLYQINKIIEEVMGSTGGTDTQKKGIRAEALATRAHTIFNMANYYCKPYVAATAAKDLGFPFPKTANVTVPDYPRGTLQATYDFIIKDLTDALADIPVKQPLVTRMSKPAVEGLLGKVYLFMGRYTDALPLLKAALADVIANGQTFLYDYNVTLAPGGAFLPISATSGPKSPGQLTDDLTEAVVSKVFYCGKGNGNQTGNDGLVLTPQAQALYGSGDLRLKLYINKYPNNSINPSGRIRKYGTSYSRYGLQLSELYLLSAECKARTNDLAGAVTDVQTLRQNRMPLADAVVPAAIAGDQTALIKFIIDERIREFALEGYRWFDMRRLSVDPIFAGMTFTHTMYNADGTTTVYTLRQPNRLVMKFPKNITDANPNMPDNP